MVLIVIYFFSGVFLSLGPYCLVPFGEDFVTFSRLLN